MHSAGRDKFSSIDDKVIEEEKLEWGSEDSNT